MAQCPLTRARPSRSSWVTPKVANGGIRPAARSEFPWHGRRGCDTGRSKPTQLDSRRAILPALSSTAGTHVASGRPVARRGANLTHVAARCSPRMTRELPRRCSCNCRQPIHGASLARFIDPLRAATRRDCPQCSSRRRRQRGGARERSRT